MENRLCFLALDVRTGTRHERNCLEITLVVTLSAMVSIKRIGARE
jgi:hypothetical protein